KEQINACNPRSLYLWLTGVVGRAIRINCRYDEQKYSGHRKYWCRGYYRSSCEDVIDTKAVNGQRGRFSITDKRDGVFTVTMENLTMRDAGWYNCGIDQFGRDTMVAVKVHISDGKIPDSKVTGVVGQAIRINCRYDKKTYSGHRKYWCHGYYRSSCEDVIDTKAVNGQRGRFSITDKRDGVFTVTMENLTMRDAGWYNCGIDKPGFDTMVAVKLHISDENQWRVHQY
uniref:Immunoglobulin domain-containing protein n=1 Tax=Callorhinchus milii TaxID=7868 RepID=A0A4W3J4K9_CALMI